MAASDEKFYEASIYKEKPQVSFTFKVLEWLWDNIITNWKFWVFLACIAIAVGSFGIGTSALGVFCVFHLPFLAPALTSAVSCLVTHLHISHVLLGGLSMALSCASLFTGIYTLFPGKSVVPELPQSDLIQPPCPIEPLVITVFEGDSIDGRDYGICC